MYRDGHTNVHDEERSDRPNIGSSVMILLKVLTRNPCKAALRNIISAQCSRVHRKHKELRRIWFLELRHKDVTEFLNDIVWITGSHLWMLKLMTSENRRCTHVNQWGCKSLSRRLPESSREAFPRTGEVCWWWNVCNKGPQCQKYIAKR
jgi:hypothetical protein